MDSQYFDSITKKKHTFKKDMSSVCIYRGLEPRTLQWKRESVGFSPLTYKALFFYTSIIERAFCDLSLNFKQGGETW
jgi:hypothetical protein